MSTTVLAPPEVVTVPVGPNLSMFDPMHIGIDEMGQRVTLDMMYRNLLAAGEPGSGKSGLLNTIAAHAALSVNTRLILFDGKLVELGQWADLADEFVGPDISKAILTLRKIQKVMDNRYQWLAANRRRKIEKTDDLSVIVVMFDELAYYSATVGTKQEQEQFSVLLRDVVARGRAAGIIPIAATQRPSVDIIPTSLRDLFGFRCAFRCTTPGSSTVILGQGWGEQGFDATTISKNNPGSAYLLAEGGMPFKVKVSYMSDDEIASMVDYASWIRKPQALQGGGLS